MTVTLLTGTAVLTGAIRVAAPVPAPTTVLAAIRAVRNAPAAPAARDGRPVLIVTRGLPGSGKTTWATTWVAEQPARRARANRDDLRRMLHGRRLGTAGQEAMVSTLQHQGVAQLLGAGISVVADDTNLTDTAIRTWQQIARTAGARLQIQDLTGVPVDECIARDATRPAADRVGEHVIRQMHADHLTPSHRHTQEQP